jgi:hypothetical protein
MKARPLHNTPFCPITVSGSNFNPRNTQCIPVVKILTFLVLGQNWMFFKGLESIKETSRIISDADLMAEIRQGLKALKVKRAKVYTLEEL